MKGGFCIFVDFVFLLFYICFYYILGLDVRLVIFFFLEVFVVFLDVVLLLKFVLVNWFNWCWEDCDCIKFLRLVFGFVVLNVVIFVKYKVKFNEFVVIYLRNWIVIKVNGRLLIWCNEFMLSLVVDIFFLYDVMCMLKDVKKDKECSLKLIFYW